ncbi:hypothetical protein BSZ39_05050 [Bowdeniella nasicola]|uniref:Uncharacterized protein n=2 Tax=Bowdeniella nasicola TaxID=208480 RepID=A0A1Q5Q360_9ACTO|nr:hypothetical protein BSZ39_05050 [Bowdeniella nasicola]
MWEPAYLQRVAGGVDPEAAFEAAHESARILVSYGRSSDDSGVHARLLRLVKDEGIEVLATLWSRAVPASLPGVLWRLYALHEWIVRSGDEVARYYNAGLESADAAHVVAGVPPLHGPDEVRATIDKILKGVYDGELDIAFDRAAALISVVVAGAGEGSELKTDALKTTADDLRKAAGLERGGMLRQADAYNSDGGR